MSQVAWSWSRLNAFETCAFRFYKTSVEKSVVEAPSDAMTEGNRVHKVLELRVKGQPLPDRDAHLEPIVQTIMGAGGRVEAEQKLAITKQLAPTTYFGKGPGKEAWCRSIADVTVEKGTSLAILDYKTGAPGRPSAQLKLSAGVGFIHKPHIQKIVVSYLWLKTGGTTSEVYTRADIPAIWQDLLPRVDRYERAHDEGKWPKNPSGLCRNHCPVPRKMCEHRGS